MQTVGLAWHQLAGPCARWALAILAAAPAWALPLDTHAANTSAPPSNPAPDCLDATGLQSLKSATITQGQPTLLYLWSPRMVYAVTGATHAWQASKQLGLDFVPLLDARISRLERSAALQSPAATALPAALRKQLAQAQTLCSNDLLGADATLHWPSSFVIQQGRIHTHAIRGAMPLAQWIEAIQQRLKPFQQIAASAASTPSAARFTPQPALSTHTQVKHTPANVKPTNAQPLDGQTCIAPNQWVPLPPKLAGTAVDAYGNTQVSIGSYERISPDGRFVLRSFSGAQLGQVSLVEIDAGHAQQAARVTRIVPTRLKNEAFPVQGSWRYLVDINGDHYRFADILQTPEAARPLFNAGMSGFYAAAAEVSTHSPAQANTAPKAETVQIRSLSWPTGNAEADTQGQGSLVSRTITVDTRNHKILHDSGNRHHCLSRSRIDGNQYALPMISVDGTEFAALPQNPVQGAPHIRVFGFGDDGAQCVPKAQFPSVAGKAIFGFGQPAGPADLVYEYRGQVWWYVRQLGRAINIAPWEDATSPIRNISASAFPGITRDGRVIYAATWQQCQGKACQAQSGYIITDPYQSNAYQQLLQSGDQPTPDKPSCITHAHVAQAVNDFAQFHQIALPTRGPQSTP